MSEAPEAIAEAVERIRTAVEHWGDAGCEGTYVADAMDYGKLDIAVLRDSRTLLAALEAEREAHARRVGELDRCNERVLEVLAVLEYERNEFDKALATAEAALEAKDGEVARLREALVEIKEWGARSRIQYDGKVAGQMAERALAAAALTPSTPPDLREDAP